MYHSFLIHSSANGHLGCFHVLAIVNSQHHLLKRLAFLHCIFLSPWIRGDSTQEVTQHPDLQHPWKTQKSWLHWATCDRAADLVSTGVGDHPPPRQELGREEEATLMPGLRPSAHPARTPWARWARHPLPWAGMIFSLYPLAAFRPKWPRFAGMRERKQF